MINDLQSVQVKLTLLPLQANAIGQRSYLSVVHFKFALIITLLFLNS